MNTNLRSSLLVVLFASFASVACAHGNDNNDADFGAKARDKVQQGREWTKAKCKTIREEFTISASKGSAKWQEFTDEVRELADKKLGTNFGRKQSEKLKEADLIKLQVPFEIAEGQTPTGSEPIKRSTTITVEEVIGGEKVTITSTELPNDAAWFAWLDTEEGKMFATGAIAVITIAGLTYVLYKNRVPQRVYGYAVKNPITAAVSAVCVVGIALYLAKDKLCLPVIVQ